MILASIHFQQSFLENHMQETDKKLRLKESSFVTQVLLTTLRLEMSRLHGDNQRKKVNSVLLDLDFFYYVPNK